MVSAHTLMLSWIFRPVRCLLGVRGLSAPLAPLAPRAQLVRPEELALAGSRLTKLAVSEIAFTCSLPKIGHRQRKKK